jgi:hypothetical protein
VIATAGVQDQLALGREAVAMLDPIVTKKLAGQNDLLAGWRSAKRVTQPSQSAGVLAVAGAQAVTAVPGVPAPVSPSMTPSQTALPTAPTPGGVAASAGAAARATNTQEVKAA